MKRYRTLVLALPAAAMVFLVGCADEKTTEESSEEVPEVSVDEANDNAVTSSLLKLDSEIFSLPSPVQTALLLEKNDIAFKEELLNSIANEERYINLFKKALNMGVYGADLAYLSNFNNAQMKLDYFKVVDNLAGDLDIRNNIDQSIIDRFAANIDNPDSLYALNARLFKAADQYLKQNDDNDIASLILAGGWIEALYLSVDAARNNDALRNRIAEQGIAARSLVNLLSRSEDPQTLELASKLALLASDFKGVEYEYEYVKPITDPSERVTYLNSKSRVGMSDKQLDILADRVADIRQYIIE
jgi:hypothetical protein